VVAVAESLQYRPNRAARSLASGRSGVIGLVLPVDQLVNDPYGAILINGVAQSAAARDHGLMLWMTHKEPGATVRELFSGGLVDGLVISAIALGDTWVEKLLDGPLPTVLVGRHPNRSDTDMVEIDNTAAARLVVEHLIGLGHRRIATITGPEERSDAMARLATFHTVLAEHDLEAPPELVVKGDFSPWSGLSAMVRLLPHRPTAVFAANDQMALGALEAINLAGLRVPDDISVAGFDDFPAALVSNPPLTTVGQDVDLVADRAVAHLISLLGTGTSGSDLLVGAELRVRGSTGSPAPSPDAAGPAGTGTALHPVGREDADEETATAGSDAPENGEGSPSGA
jgi:DNA-binding LacI/PurR family transcriptional regulator